jgi:hypothetical protein
MKWSTIKGLAEVKYFNICYIVLIAIPICAGFYVGGGFASPHFTVNDLKAPSALASRLKQKHDAVSVFLNACLPESTAILLGTYEGNSVIPVDLQYALVQSLNAAIARSDLDDELRFPQPTLRQETLRMRQRSPEGRALIRLNRMLLEDAYPTELNRKLWLGGFPEFPFSLKLLFLASLLYAIGIAIYQFFCPEVIKAHTGDVDYYNTEKEIHLNARPDKRLSIVLAQLLPEQKAVIDSLDDLVRLQNEAPNSALQTQIDAIIDQHHGSCVQQYLLRNYARENSSRFPGILACLLFYVAGTLVMSWLLLKKCVDVFSA